MEEAVHPRIATVADFYRNGPKLCSFMSPDVTLFILVPEEYNDQHVGPPILDWAKTGQPRYFLE